MNNNNNFNNNQPFNQNIPPAQNPYYYNNANQYYDEQCPYYNNSQRFQYTPPPMVNTQFHQLQELNQSQENKQLKKYDYLMVNGWIYTFISFLFLGFFCALMTYFFIILINLIDVSSSIPILNFSYFIYYRVMDSDQFKFLFCFCGTIISSVISLIYGIVLSAKAMNFNLADTHSMAISSLILSILALNFISSILILHIAFQKPKTTINYDNKTK